MQIKYSVHIPVFLEENTLYVSREFEMAIHICPCGCNQEVATPLNEEGWQLSAEAGPTLKPSIKNRDCKAHYFLTNGAFQMLPA
jgi:hypothetical protein